MNPSPVAIRNCSVPKGPSIVTCGAANNIDNGSVIGVARNHSGISRKLTASSTVPSGVSQKLASASAAAGRITRPSSLTAAEAGAETGAETGAIEGTSAPSTELLSTAVTTTAANCTW